MIGAIKGDARSLDFSSVGPLVLPRVPTTRIIGIWGDESDPLFMLRVFSSDNPQHGLGLLE